MSYVIPVKVYTKMPNATPVYRGEERIKVPHVTTHSTNFYLSDYNDKFYDMKCDVTDDGTWNVLKPSWWQPLSSLNPNPLGEIGCNYKNFEYSNDLPIAMGLECIIYEIKYHGDGHVRQIKMYPRYVSSTYDVDYNHSMEWKFEYILDNELIFDFEWVSVGAHSAMYNINFGERVYQVIYSGCSFPWKVLDFNSNNEVFGYVNISASYKKDKIDPAVKPYDLSGNITIIRSAGANTTNFNTWLANYEPEEINDEDPYEGGGTTTEQDPNDIGNFSDDSDSPTADGMPTLSAVGTGFATIFKPSSSQLKSLSELFWNSNFFTFMQNLVENISGMFTSLAIVPFNVTAGRTVSVTWLGFDTAVSLTLAAQQYYELDMGTIDLGNDSRAYRSASALDYAPFSSLGIYLPFIGYRDLNIDEVRNASVNLRYRIDILSGSCVAILKVGGKDIYEFSGNCLSQIPITNESMQSLVADAVQVGIASAMVADSAIAGGGDAAIEAAEEGSAIGVLNASSKAGSEAAIKDGTMNHLAAATANAAIGIKPNYARTGSISGATSLMAVKQPFLYLKTPRQAIPEDYQRYCGFPSNITGSLGSFSGFTVVEDIRLNGLVATSSEVAEIYALLKKGVII